jgi:hypothetical protein
MRSTAFHWNFREYRFRFTLLSSLSKVCPSELSHFKGSLHVRVDQIVEVIVPGRALCKTELRALNLDKYSCQ